MKRTLILITIVALGAAFTAPADAAKGKKNRKQGGDALATYDKDSNGKIDGTEVEALKADFTAGKAAAKALDTNADGTLSDEEIAAAGAHHGKKRKKKNQ
jgi:hypothetical protein